MTTSAGTLYAHLIAQGTTHAPTVVSGVKSSLEGGTANVASATASALFTIDTFLDMAGKSAPAIGKSAAGLALGFDIWRAKEDIRERGIVYDSTYMNLAADLAALSALAVGVTPVGAALIVGAGALTAAGLLMGDNQGIHNAISGMTGQVIDMAQQIGSGELSKHFPTMSSPDNSIGAGVGGLFNNARTWVPPARDPLALDLDHDGIETTAADGAVLFDHDGDGILTGTGWVGADDGLLAWDRNGNGAIDNGAELFGVDTVLANGQKASDGFAALRDLDDNSDGVFNAQDTRFGDVRVWRDLDQNGASLAEEFFSLQSLDIAAINLDAVTETINLGNGNIQTAAATYLLTDGTTAAAGIGSTGATAANLELAINSFYRRFSDSVALTEEARLLPQMQGSGRVRDLREAVSLSGELAARVFEYGGQSTRANQLALIDEILNSWGTTSDMTTSVEQASAFGYRLIYLEAEMDVAEHDELLPYWNTNENDLMLLRPEQREILARLKASQDRIAQTIGTLERFNGLNFVSVDANGATTGQGWRLDAENGPGADNIRRVYVSLMSEQSGLLGTAYQSLKESVYSGLALQTRLKPYLDEIGLQLDANGLRPDFSGMTDLLYSLKQTDAANALTDMVELHKLAGASLYSWGWNALSTLRAWVEEAANDAVLQGMLAELGVRRNFDDPRDALGKDLVLGQAGDDYLFGQNGNNLLSGDAGDDRLLGEGGNDVLSGGMGTDIIDGGVGDDTYIFDRGDGQDVIYDTEGFDTIRFGVGVLSSEVEFFRDASDHSSLVLSNTALGDRVMVQGWFGGADYEIERVAFNDGTVWDRDMLASARIVGTDEGDSIIGDADADTIEGRGGDDYITGDAGNDILIGGAGNDYLFDCVDGNDTYIFDRGDGQDVIYDTEGFDTIRFGAGLMSSEVEFFRDVFDPNNLVLSNIASGDRVTILGWFSGVDYEIERVVFNDGTVWDRDMLASARIVGTDGDDYIIGDAGDNTLVGGAGNDYFFDCVDGNDTYIFNRGDGQDVIYDTGGTDTASFGIGIDRAEIALFASGYDLEIGYSVNDRVSVGNFFSSANYQVDEVELADGSNLTAADINRIIQDMAAYAVNEGIALNSVNDVRNNEQLMSIIANSWHA